MSRFISDLFRVGISKICIIIFGLGVTIITARYLGPEQNGIIAGLLIYPSLFMSVASLGISQSATYFLGKGIYSEGKIKTAITQIWFFTSVVSVIISYFLMTFFSKSGGNLSWVILSLIPIPFNLFVTYNSGIFLGKGEIKEFNKVNWLPQLMILVFVIVFIIFLKMRITGFLLASIWGPMVMFVIMLYKNDFIKFFNFIIEWSIIKSMLYLGATYAVALLVISLNYRIDIIILDKLSTPFETGIYSKGAAITQYLWQIPMVLSTIVFSRSATSQNDIQFSNKVAHLLRLSLIAIGVISAILMAFSKFIILNMYGEQFINSTKVLKILLPGVIILTLFKVMNMDLAGKGKPWVSMKAMIPALIINVVINIIFIPEYGAEAASWSSTISYAVAGVLFLHLYSKESGISVRNILIFKKNDFIPIMKLIKRKG